MVAGCPIAPYRDRSVGGKAPRGRIDIETARKHLISNLLCHSGGTKGPKNLCSLRERPLAVLE